MKLNYFDLLSPDPVYLRNTGGIVSPKLRDISSIGYETYQYYLSILLMDLKTGLARNSQLTDALQTILNFFIKEDVVYSPDKNVFLVKKEDAVVGVITEETYPEVCDIIFQRNCIRSGREEDLSKVKSKKALEIMKKLQKGRAEKEKQAKADKDMELGNIISAVANKSQSLNILNIWELTVYQVWDCFSRLINNSIFDIQSMSVAAWGDKDNHFDFHSWFKQINKGN